MADAVYCNYYVTCYSETRICLYYKSIRNDINATLQFSTFRILLLVQTHDLGYRTEINRVFMKAVCFKVPLPFSISSTFFTHKLRTI